MHFEHKFLIKNMLNDYLKQKGINVNKNFKCLNNCSGSKQYTMGFKNDMIRCFRCGKKFDIYELIGLDYSLSTFREQYQQACILFNFEDDFNKYKYKQSAKQAKNSILEYKKIEEEKYKKYNNFYNKLINKRKELLIQIDLFKEDKNSFEYNDFKFKLDFIDDFTNNILEYNDKSFEAISHFNDCFNKAYSVFKKYYLDI